MSILLDSSVEIQHIRHLRLHNNSVIIESYIQLTTRLDVALRGDPIPLLARQVYDPAWFLLTLLSTPLPLVCDTLASFGSVIVRFGAGFPVAIHSTMALPDSLTVLGVMANCVIFVGSTIQIIRCNEI